MDPILIDLNDYVRTGEGANGASFNHKTDPSIMMKLYLRNFKNWRWRRKCMNSASQVPNPVTW